MNSKCSAGSAGRGLCFLFLRQLLLIAALLTGASTYLFSQQPSPFSPEALRPYGLSGITLTSEQQSRFSGLKAEYASKYKAFASQMNTRLKETGERASESDRTRAQAIKESHLADIRRMLTPAQAKQFDTNVAQMRAESSRMRDSLSSLRANRSAAPAPKSSKIPVLLPDPSVPKEIKTKIKPRAKQSTQRTSSATQE